MSGVILKDNQCDDWSGGANRPFGSDFILSIDSSNPGCNDADVEYDIYIHFGAQWGCAGHANVHRSPYSGAHMWVYVR